jgi:hypothetical protein
MKNIKSLIVLLVTLISPLLSAADFDDYTPSDISQNINYNLLAGSLETSNYELREYSYITVSGNFISKKLYFISSEQGVQNAFNNAGLSYEAYQDLLQDYSQSFSLSNIVNSSNSSINGLKSKEFITILDPEVMDIKNNQDFEAYKSKYSLSTLTYIESTEVDSRYSTSCPSGWKCRSKNYNKQNAYYNLNKDIKIYQSSSVESGVRLSGRFNYDANASVDYRYKKKFGIPYKVKIDFIDSKLDYDFDGTINLYGKLNYSVEGKEFELHQAKIYDKTFMVGPIPVQIDIKTYIRVGTGDLDVEASGEVALTKPISYKGSYKYTCDNQDCYKEGESISVEKDSLTGNDISYQLGAKAKIEPYINAAIRGRLYWGSIYVEVGAQASLPIVVQGYYGNMCGDANKDGSNETVAALIGTIGIDAGITLKGKFLFNKSKRKYISLNYWHLAYFDFLNPSTALSPLLLSQWNSSFNSLAGPSTSWDIGLRECSQDLLPKKYQNFIVNWGDGQVSEILGLENRLKINHEYENIGSYNIIISHENGARTITNYEVETLQKAVACLDDSTFNTTSPFCPAGYDYNFSIQQCVIRPPNNCGATEW